MTKKYINNLYERDAKALLAISKCGHCSKNELKNYVADKRLWSYVKDGLAEKEVFNKFNGETLEGYKLTAQGRKLVEKEYGFKDHQQAQSLKHDLGISEKYFSIEQEERDTWKTETELRNCYEEEMQKLYKEDHDRYAELREMEQEHKISPVDACYTDRETGVEVGYEVTTNNYGQAEIMAKENFTEILGLTYTSRGV